MPTSAWTPSDLPALDGRTFVVTGANSGIGRRAAHHLADRGAHVILAVRTVEKGEAAAAEMSGSTEVRRLDLSDLASVRAFADTFSGDDAIDVLINNAGLMGVPESRTADGFEMQIGTNHLGHFALTNLLLPRITGRVVTVASSAHRMGKIRLDDLNWEKPGSYDRWRAYGQSKLANLLFNLELQRRLVASDSDVIATAAHPGWASTHLQERTGSRLQNLAMSIGNKVLAQSDEAGSWPTLYAATADLPGDAYVGPRGFQEMRGTPVLVGRTGAARDESVAKALWERSEELTGVTFPLAVAVAA
jgi:NAD(P)-dependent dehydrogenase (short-subunit alcohol dehydrogenase family)